jgi:hypothetical protein
MKKLFTKYVDTTEEVSVKPDEMREKAMWIFGEGLR